MIYDALIIGSGPGGYECARWISKLGGKAILFEKKDLGGVCTNCGCIPTKAFAASANLIDKFKNSKNLGVTCESVSADMGALVSRRDRVVKVMRAGVKKLLDDGEVEVVYGEAEIIDSKTVECGGQTYSGQNLVIASGSAPTGVGSIQLDGEYIISGDEAAKLMDFPKKMVIIGGGFIGCEYASILASFGVDITLIEVQPTILPAEDSEVTELLQNILSKKLTLKINASVEKVDSAKKIVVCDGEIIPADLVLLAVGRKHMTPKGFEKLNVATAVDGVLVDETMRTNVDGVYAIGDVTTHVRLAHAAYLGGESAAKSIMGIESKADFDLMPWCVFSNPEIGRVGVTEKEAKLIYSDIRIGRAQYTSNGKARCMGERAGFVKVISDADGHLIGLHIIGSNASSLLGEAGLALTHKMKLEDIIQTIHAHPTLCELLREACINAIQ